MKKCIFLLIIACLLFVLASCSGVSDEDVAATVVAQVEMGVSQTLEARPTSTPYSTAVPQETATAYATVAPYSTATPYATQEPYPTSTAYPTFTPIATATFAVTNEENVAAQENETISVEPSVAPSGLDLDAAFLAYAQATNQNLILVGGIATRVDLGEAGSSVQECPDLLTLNAQILAPFPQDLSSASQNIQQLNGRIQQGIIQYVDGSKEFVGYCQQRVDQGVDERIAPAAKGLTISAVAEAKNHLEFVIKALGGF